MRAGFVVQAGEFDPARAGFVVSVDKFDSIKRFVMLSRSEASLVRQAEILRFGCGLRSE